MTTWATQAPEKAVDLKARLMESATLKKLFGARMPYHYPDLDPSTATFPACVIVRERFKARRQCQGENDQSYNLTATFYFDEAVHSIARVERDFEIVCKELCEWETEGMAIIGAEALRCSEPKRAQLAAGDDADGRAYRTCTLLVEGE
jgi:hypothetical protein